MKKVNQQIWKKMEKSIIHNRTFKKCVGLKKGAEVNLYTFRE